MTSFHPIYSLNQAFAGFFWPILLFHSYLEMQSKRCLQGLKLCPECVSTLLGRRHREVGCKINTAQSYWISYPFIKERSKIEAIFWNRYSGIILAVKMLLVESSSIHRTLKLNIWYQWEWWLNEYFIDDFQCFPFPIKRQCQKKYLSGDNLRLLNNRNWP